MANASKVNDKGVQVITLDTTGSIVLGNAMGTSKIGSWALQVVSGGAAPGSLVLKQRLHGSGLSGANWLATLYYDESTTTVPSAGDAIVANGLFTIISDRKDVQLDYTADADGMTVYAVPYNG